MQLQGILVLALVDSLGPSSFDVQNKKVLETSKRRRVSLRRLSAILSLYKLEVSTNSEVIMVEMIMKLSDVIRGQYSLLSHLL